jgi:hypothetical protein
MQEPLFNDMSPEDILAFIQNAEKELDQKIAAAKADIEERQQRLARLIARREGKEDPDAKAKEKAKAKAKKAKEKARAKEEAKAKEDGKPKPDTKVKEEAMVEEEAAPVTRKPRGRLPQAAALKTQDLQEAKDADAAE